MQLQALASRGRVGFHGNNQQPVYRPNIDWRNRAPMIVCVGGLTMRANQRVSENAAPYGKKRGVRKQVRFRRVRRSEEEIARRGQAIYARKVKPHLKSTDIAKFAAIDVDTSEFEINADEIRASDILHERLPDAVIWMERIGSPTLRRFGGYGLGMNSVRCR